MTEFTPSKIEHLGPNEIFVFGSNLQGTHQGGTARIAVEKFGAVRGVGSGLQGQSYAIPTMLSEGIQAIQPYVEQFFRIAELLPDLKFYVTRIGCGKAGFKDEEIAPLFRNALEIDNVVLPKEFYEILCPERPEKGLNPLWMWKMGLGDMSKAFAGEDPLPDKSITATKEMFKDLKPLEGQTETVAIKLRVNAAAMEILRKGHIPATMEDHWLMICEENRLTYYRSWTSIPLFQAVMVKDTDKPDCYRFIRLTINRNPEQYGQTDTAKDIALFTALIYSECGLDATEYWKKAQP